MNTQELINQIKDTINNLKLEILTKEEILDKLTTIQNNNKERSYTYE